MKDWTERIGELDLDLFATIPSQTSDGDRRSLLAVQRATANKHGTYAYLEIGSHLGGSIQPHLVDDRCRRIYSIDVRPGRQPDDRSPGFIAVYENNSTANMLSHLGEVGAGNLEKITCFDSQACRVDKARIEIRPRIAFIDGEHTKEAVISDYHFCREVLSEGGCVVFHDFSIIHPAIRMIRRILRAQRIKNRAVKLEGDTFAIFFDPEMVREDRYLARLNKRTKRFMAVHRLKTSAKKALPLPLLASFARARACFKKKPAR